MFSDIIKVVDQRISRPLNCERIGPVVGPKTGIVRRGEVQEEEREKIIPHNFSSIRGLGLTILLGAQ